MSNPLREAIKLYGARMREYMRSEAELDGIGYPMKWDDELNDAILDAVIAALPDVEIRTRGTTQSPDNAAYWTKGTKVRFETIEEIKTILQAAKTPSSDTKA